jgi:hypothetical protein
MLYSDHIKLSFLGDFDDSVTNKLIEISELYITQNTELVGLKKKVSFLIAECYQNVVRYQEKNSIELSRNYFQLNLLNDRTVLSSCNLIKKAEGKILEEKLKRLSLLNEVELKALYQEVLNNDNYSDKGGAGLGLIEMARKSGLPIKFYFRDVDKDFSQYFLALEIVKKGLNIKEQYKIEDTLIQYDNLIKENIVIEYGGEFYKDLLIPLINLSQDFFMSKKDNSNGKKILVSLIEVLQNISKHGKRINDKAIGYFSISKTNDSFIIFSENYTDHNNYLVLEKRLSEILKLNEEELKIKYNDILMSSEINEKGNTGLGLYEIARNSRGNFAYKLEKIDQDSFKFEIKITI